MVPPFLSSGDAQADVGQGGGPRGGGEGGGHRQGGVRVRRRAAAAPAPAAPRPRTPRRCGGRVSAAHARAPTHPSARRPRERPPRARRGGPRRVPPRRPRAHVHRLCQPRIRHVSSVRQRRRKARPGGGSATLRGRRLRRRRGGGPLPAHVLHAARRGPQQCVAHAERGARDANRFLRGEWRAHARRRPSHRTAPLLPPSRSRRIAAGLEAEFAAQAQAEAAAGLSCSVMLAGSAVAKARNEAAFITCASPPLNVARFADARIHPQTLCAPPMPLSRRWRRRCTRASTASTRATPCGTTWRTGASSRARTWRDEARNNRTLVRHRAGQQDIHSFRYVQKHAHIRP